jgi:hypothetical protein
MKLQMRVTGPNRLLGAWEMLALLEYIHHIHHPWTTVKLPANWRSRGRRNHLEDGIGDINTLSPPSRPRSQRVRMIVPEPPLLGGSPLAFEVHTEDESEDGLSPRKRHRHEVSDTFFGRFFFIFGLTKLS